MAWKHSPTSQRFHMDALARVDADLAIYTARQLEQIRAQVYEKKYPELKGRLFVPVNNGINEGAQSYTVHTMDETGAAEFVEDYGADVPMADAKLAAEDNYKMRRVQLGYGWSYDELMAARYAGVDLTTRKANNCRRGIERLIDKSLLIGTAKTSQALFSLSGVQAPLTYTPSVLTYEDETPDAIANDLRAFLSNVITQSKEIENPNRLGLPISTMELTMDRRMGQGSNVTIYDYVLGVSQKRRADFQVVTSHYLEVSGGHSGGAVKRMVAWEYNDECIEGFVNEFTQLQPEYKGLRVVTLCTARVGGVGAHRNKSVSYGDGI